jgi:hypothetical protein
MSRIKRMSPALVVAILALVAALVVPAVAQVATKALSKREVRRVRHIARFQANRQITRRTPRIANNRITARAPGLSVDSAVNATSATNAESATSADHATSADDASTANGVRPVNVDYTAADNSGAVTLLDEGGLQVKVFCALGDGELLFAITADNGTIRVDWIDPNGTVAPAVESDFDHTEGLGQNTSGWPSYTASVNYRGASGTTVSGSLHLVKGAPAAQCLVSGTLFVG